MLWPFLHFQQERLYLPLVGPESLAFLAVEKGAIQLHPEPLAASTLKASHGGKKCGLERVTMRP